MHSTHSTLHTAHSTSSYCAMAISTSKCFVAVSMANFNRSSAMSAGHLTLAPHSIFHSCGADSPMAESALKTASWQLSYYYQIRTAALHVHKYQPTALKNSVKGGRGH